MSEVFNFKRFWTYFKYDLKQMWRNHSKVAVVIGGSVAILYIIWVLFSLVFSQTWTAPHLFARYFMFGLALMILEFYQTRTYGFLTEKKAGSAWLMIPASRAEKFVSMLLMTLIVIPVLFVVVFFLLDGFLSLVDPTYGQSLIGSIAEFSSALPAINVNSPVIFTFSAFLLMSVLSCFFNFLYFLLCGICFKRFKILLAIAISFGFSLILLLILGTILSSKGVIVINDDMQGARILAGFLNGADVICALISIGLGWGIWRRIKTIQH